MCIEWIRVKNDSFPSMLVPFRFSAGHKIRMFRFPHILADGLRALLRGRKVKISKIRSRNFGLVLCLRAKRLDPSIANANQRVRKWTFSKEKKRKKCSLFLNLSASELSGDWLYKKYHCSLLATCFIIRRYLIWPRNGVLRLTGIFP